MAFPIRVFLIKSCSATIRQTERRMVMMLTPENWISPSTRGGRSKTELMGRGAEEKKIRARFCRQRLTAMAVMSTERLGAPRRGL